MGALVDDNVCETRMFVFNYTNLEYFVKNHKIMIYIVHSIMLKGKS
jgi:hypothetical protein